MSEIRWVLAVVAPWTISPHPNFSVASVDGPELLSYFTTMRLADLSRDRDKLEPATPPWVLPAIEDLVRTFDSETGPGVTAAQAELVNAEPLGLQARAAFALLLSVAYADRDEPELACELVANLLDDFSKNSRDSHHTLTHAILRQQLAVRSYEARRVLQARDNVDEAVALLASLNVDEGPTFRVSRGVGWSSRQVLSDVVEASRHNAAALRVRLDDPNSGAWVEVVRSRTPWLSSRVRAEGAARDGAFVDELFNRLTDAVTMTERFGGYPGTESHGFANLVTAETSGDIDEIQRGRAGLAKLRLLDPSLSQPWATWEALNLLRRSGDARGLKSALALVRSQGPLVGLRRAALEVLNRSSFPERLDRLDLELLAGAGDLLDETEVVRVLAALWEDPSRPGQAWHSWGHLDRWKVVAAMLDVSTTHADIARRALSVMLTAASDHVLLSSTIANILSRLRWADVSDVDKQAWLEWGRHYVASRESDALDVAHAALDALEGRRGGSDVLGVAPLVALTNKLVNKVAVSELEYRNAQRFCLSLISENHESLVAGRRSFGGYDSLEVATAFAITAADVEVATAVAEVLADPVVSGDAKALALDRVAILVDYVTPKIAACFKRVFPAVLSEMRRSGVFGLAPQLPVFAEALRAGLALDLVDESAALEGITSLITSKEVAARSQAAKTLASYAKTGSFDLVHSSLLQLCRDVAPTVRAAASQALSSTGHRSSSVGSLVRIQIEENLRSDGMLVVVAALRGLDGSLVAAFAPVLEDLRQTHPSSRVRILSDRVLMSLQPGEE